MALVKFKIVMKRPSGLGQDLEIKGKEREITALSAGDMDDRARETEQYLQRILGLDVTIEVDIAGIVAPTQHLKIKM